MKTATVNSSPFSSTPRGVWTIPLDGGWACAFNFDEPDGVKLLRGKALERLRSILQRGEPIPVIDESEDPIDIELERHKLLIMRNNAAAYRSRPVSHTKSFNVWLHVVNGCNFRCFYCYVPHLEKSVDPKVLTQHAMSAETSHHVADKLLSFCEKNAIPRLHIKFAGGEPTLDLSLISNFCDRMARTTSGVRVSFGMISNGSFDADDLMPLLERHKIGLSLSVDGIEETHDRVRFSLDANKNKVGSWRSLQHNIDRLCHAGIKPYILYTVTALNAPSLNRFAAWSHSHELGFRLSLVRLPRLPRPAESRIILSHLIDLYENLAIDMPTKLRFERDARFAEWNLKKKKRIACGSCRNYVAITEKGEIRSCQMASDSLWNVRQHTFDDAIEGFKQDRQTALIAMPDDRIGGCTKCQFFHVCTGGCPQHTWSVYESTDQPSPWCDTFGQMVPVYVKACAMHLLRRMREIQNERRTHELRVSVLGKR